MIKIWTQFAKFNTNLRLADQASKISKKAGYLTSRYLKYGRISSRRSSCKIENEVQNAMKLSTALLITEDKKKASYDEKNITL